MNEECVFCRIVDGEVPARVVHETEDVLAFLDANPLAPGHVLAIPKTHHERLADLPDETANALYGVLHALVPVAETVAEAPASTVGFNNGPEAGQEVPHVHGHVIPRFADDGGRPLHGVAGTPPDLDEDALDEIATAMADRMK